MKKFFLATLAALSLTVCLYAQEDMLPAWKNIRYLPSVVLIKRG